MNGYVWSFEMSPCISVVVSESASKGTSVAGVTVRTNKTTITKKRNNSNHEKMTLTLIMSFAL